MHIHTIYRPMDDFGQCMVSNSRKAARAITRRYDAFARPFGITATQFSLLGIVIEAGEQNLSELAEARGFERTTLTRNLDRLEKLGLIVTMPPEHGNARVSSITDMGRAVVQQILPAWRKAQAELRGELGGPEFDRTIATLKRLAAV